ncbi:MULTISPECIES: hypothetical protein [unclassified Legionella]|uniref:hypothetical protein n=1 Tax=unclassified Legionella TaxID=2622702 RepID=UPI00105519E1|nr:MULTISPECIES: hypothetical protein [unclassified Legionella]MDI9819044.1 hypothetical protein [Legionella sp. PL877]
MSLFRKDKSKETAKASLNDAALKAESNKSKRRTLGSFFSNPFQQKARAGSLQLKPETVDEFIETVRQGGNYLQKLEDKHWEILIKVANQGQFPENIDFLKKFNDYIENKTTGENLYHYLDGLNIDDDGYTKSLAGYRKDNLLDSETAKEAYTQIAVSITSLLISNLRTKRNTIENILQPADDNKIGHGMR